MTFEELKDYKTRWDDMVENAYGNYNKREWEYIEERLPFPFRKYQMVTVALEVTEKTRSFLTEEYKDKPSYQEGHKYTVTGRLVGYIIGEDGEIRPCFWAGKPYYSKYDKILNITIAKKQYPERCGGCGRFRDGACFVSGGEKPDKLIAEDSFICGYYYERR